MSKARLWLADRGIATKYPVIIVALSLFAAAVTGIVAYTKTASEMRLAAENKLTALREARTTGLSQYLNAIRQDLRLLATNPSSRVALVEFIQAWHQVAPPATTTLQRLYIVDNPHPLGEKDMLDQAPDGSEYSAVHRRYHPWFRGYLNERGYYDLFLFSPDGNLVYTVFKEADFATNLEAGRWRDTALGKAFRAARDNPEPGYQAFYDFEAYAPSQGAPASFISTPMFDDVGTLIGVLAFQMPNGRLNRIMQVAAGMGETGETYIVGRDLLMRTDSLFSESSTTLQTEIDTLSVREALDGKTGVAVVQSHHGASAISAYGPMEFLGAQWAVIAEANEAEVLAPVYQMREFIVIAGVFIAVMVGAISIYVAGRLSRPIVNMASAMTRLADDDLDVIIPATERRDELGRMAHALDVFRHNAERRKRSEKALRESEVRFRNLIEGSIQGIVIHTDFKPVFVNQTAADMFGYDSPKEMLAIDNVLDLLMADEHERIAGYAKSRLAGGEAPLFYEMRGRRKDGSEVWLENRATNVDWMGKPAVQSTVVDVSERKRAEQELRDSERNLREILETSPIGITIIRRDALERLYVNPRFVELFDAESAAQMLELNLADSFVDPADFDRLTAAAESGRPPSGFEVQRRRLDGSTWWNLMDTSTINYHGEEAYIVWHYDISKRKQAEQDLADYQRLLRTVIDAVPAIITVKDRDLRFVLVNRMQAEELGCEPEQALGKRRDEFPRAGVLPVEDRRYTEQQFDREAEVLRAGESILFYEESFTRADGNVEHRLVSKIPLRDADGAVDAILTVALDITDRKRAEEQLAQKEDLLRTTIESMPAGVTVYDNGKDRRMVMHNAKFIEMLGCADDLVHDGQPIAGIIRYLAERGAYGPGDPDILTASRLSAFEAGVPDGIEYDIGDRAIEVLFGETADRGIVSIMTDISERKQAERLKNEFVSTVSHELRTPLTSIAGSLGLIAGGVTGELSERAQQLVTIARNNCDRLVRLINDILDLEKMASGRIDFRMELVPLGPLVEQAVEATRAFGEGLGVRYQVESRVGAAMVWADADRLTQVITNLLSNAAKFSGDAETVDVAVAKDELDLVVSITDHGPGIPLEFRDRIFQRFAQADSSDMRPKGGTGLGLAIVKSIVERLNGEVGFDTALERGTTFHVRLPEVRDYRQAVTDSDLPRVLVCEDDQDIATLIGLMLEQRGLEADFARSAGEARAKLATDTYAAMTLDLQLPDQDGLTLLSELRQDNRTRELPVIVVSVKADESREIVNSDAVQVVDWLNKPIDRERLLSAVEIALRRENGGRAAVLHVEDDPDVSHLLRTSLDTIADVTAVTSVAAAKRAVDASSFDVIVLDLSLPDGHGLELLSILRTLTPPPKIIVFSVDEVGSELAQDVAAALTKSKTSMDELVERIGQYVGRETSAGAA